MKKVIGCFLCVMLLVIGIAPRVMAVPSIDLQKYVSSDEEEWHDIEVTIAGPASVWYRYWVFNTGTENFDRVELIDDQLGVIGVDEGVLLPGERLEWFAEAFIDEETANVGTARGWIDGVLLYEASDQARVRVTAPVPEPTSILLLSVGLIGFAGFRKKFKK